MWLFEFAFPATRQIFIKIRLRILNQLSGSGDSIWGAWGGYMGYGYKLELARGLGTDGLLLLCLSFLTSSQCEIYSAWPEEGAPTLNKEGEGARGGTLTNWWHHS